MSFDIKARVEVETVVVEEASSLHMLSSPLWLVGGRLRQSLYFCIYEPIQFRK